MPREKEDFRDNLERVDAMYPNELIPLKTVLKHVGGDERTMKKDKTFPIKKLGGRYYVTKVALARWLS